MRRSAKIETRSGLRNFIEIRGGARSSCRTYGAGHCDACTTDASDDRLVTLFYGELDTTTGEMDLSNM
jgi:hypothetical protein